MPDMSKRRQSSDSGGGGANWMDTYGDMVTLLFAFFVLLYSFSIIDVKKLQEFTASYSKSVIVAVPTQYTPFDVVDVVEQLVNPFIPASSDDEPEDVLNPEEIDPEDAITPVDEAFRELVNHISEFVENRGIEVEILPSYAQYTLTMRFSDSVFFNVGSAAILPEAHDTLNAMILMLEEIQPVYKLLRIEGHTDNRPINTAQYPDNWALSQGRAASVLGYFLSASDELDLTKIAISGYSEYHPVDTNDTDEGRAKNRRVDFVIEGFRD